MRNNSLKMCFVAAETRTRAVDCGFESRQELNFFALSEIQFRGWPVLKQMRSFQKYFHKWKFQLKEGEEKENHKIVEIGKVMKRNISTYFNFFTQKVFWIFEKCFVRMLLVWYIFEKYETIIFVIFFSTQNCSSNLLVWHVSQISPRKKDDRCIFQSK